MKRIDVSKPYQVSFEELSGELAKVWESGYLTNRGPVNNYLESEIKKFNHLENVYVSNGTDALNLAYKALNLDKSGKILTTSFSFIATLSSLLWDGYDVELLDIDIDTFNVSTSDLLLKLQQKNVSGVVLTHVFGNPCDVEQIERICSEHNVPVIYDAAHCYGVSYKNKSLFSYGTISTCSYHATKLFHTIEGGGVFSTDKAVIKKIKELSNFGYDSAKDIVDVGINCKNSEIHAAVGLINHKKVNEIISERLRLVEIYKKELSSIVRFQKILGQTKWNGAYMPIVFSSEHELFKVLNHLNKFNIYPRRYFYPSLSKLDISTLNPCPNAESLAKRILCLPLYNGLNEVEVKDICRLIKEVI